MTLFFSVDVETTGPNPSVSDLLTLGAVVVQEDGTVTDDSFYRRIRYDRPLRWNDDTRIWWAKQSEEARRAAYEDPILSPSICTDEFLTARDLHAWVHAMLDSYGVEKGGAAFVAHPAAFDWPWIDALLRVQLGYNIFGYRALCLRSFGFGLGQRRWNEDRTDDSDLYVPSKVPHHALHDARAQAEQLSRMLRLRAQTGQWAQFTEQATKRADRLIELQEREIERLTALVESLKGGGS